MLGIMNYFLRNYWMKNHIHYLRANMLLFAPKFADPVSDFLGVDLDRIFISIHWRLNSLLLHDQFSMFVRIQLWYGKWRTWSPEIFLVRQLLVTLTIISATFLIKERISWNLELVTYRFLLTYLPSDAINFSRLGQNTLF